MELIADILLVAGALGAGFYCFVLSRRLTKFTDLENGVGGAVAVLSAQVDDLTKTLADAQNTAGESAKSLGELTERAEDVSRRLELLVASMHDLPGDSAPPAGSDTVFVRHPRN
ncbi:hypothetical protein [Tropicibacter naphthalenivorans]|uniref:Uncharacterized protein n=1 Tax=Tropicibacter naphthalenivorans TaxID=441103 RepID=A0A0P1GZH5_9RHOB|nr:hypothetical protein [Tropicibacter naphthalenivorans]CUH79127.1 hypothetical protein TRN7648_02348 [Tropicibacter naphthalenivorans]SMD03362.1 hypothetical protein SAMN04488093_11124 [Tropicibacter naphthalenivorans]